MPDTATISLRNALCAGGLVVASICSIVAALPVATNAADPPPVAGNSAAGSSAAGNGAVRPPDAVQVFPHTKQDPWDDRNHDRFPDGWTRQTGREFPHYVKIALADLPEPDAAGERALRVDLDGGAATVFSPPIEVNAAFSYVLHCGVKTEKLVHDEVFISLTFFDAQRKPLAVHHSTRQRDTPAWTQLRVGPVAPPEGDVAFAVIGLHVQPTGKFDIRGTIQFRDVWLGHLPQMQVATPDRRTIFEEGEKVEIECHVSGILEREPLITFEIADISQLAIDRSAQRLDGEVIERKNAKLSRISDLVRHETLGYAGHVNWSPNVTQPGFYRIRVTMRGSEAPAAKNKEPQAQGKQPPAAPTSQPGGLMQQRELTIAIVKPERPLATSEFGWTLPRGDQSLPLGPLADVVQRAAAMWVKFPVWHNPNDSARAQQLIRFAERLEGNGVRLVGLLDQPPSDIRGQYTETRRLFAADVFSAEPELWYRALEPVMTRLSSKVRWWQLGLDHDASFVGYPQANEKVAFIRRQLEKFGQQAYVGVGWKWNYELPSGDAPPWDFSPLTSDPPLTAAELGAYLQSPAKSGPRRWVVVDPLPEGQYDLTARAVDLIHRLMAAKIAGAEGIFVSDPFDPEHGLMTANASPGELFLTWRATALALGGAKYHGQMPLAGGSQSRLFSRGQDAVLVLWNDKPTKELLYLGKRVEQIDIWGRRTEPPREGNAYRVSVGPLPTFLTGVNEAVVRMQMGFAFNEEKLPSLFGKPYRTSFKLTNYFPQGVVATVEIQLPEQWNKRLGEIRFKLAAGETVNQEFDFPMSSDASNGVYRLPIKVSVDAEEKYQFSIHRPLEIGLGDVVINVTAKLAADGALLIRQEMVNTTDTSVDFNCYLYAPQERRRANQVYHLGRGKDVKYIRFPNGQALLDQPLRLRAEEIDGPRQLNYRFVPQDVLEDPAAISAGTKAAEKPP